MNTCQKMAYIIYLLEMVSRGLKDIMRIIAPRTAKVLNWSLSCQLLKIKIETRHWWHVDISVGRQKSERMCWNQNQTTEIQTSTGGNMNLNKWIFWTCLFLKTHHAAQFILVSKETYFRATSGSLRTWVSGWKWAGRAPIGVCLSSKTPTYPLSPFLSSADLNYRGIIQGIMNTSMMLFMAV